MGKLTRTVAALALGAAPVFGVVAAVHAGSMNGGGHSGAPGGVRAQDGVIHNQSVNGSGSIRILATDGVIQNQFAGGPAALVTPDNNGVIMSSD